MNSAALPPIFDEILESPNNPLLQQAIEGEQAGIGYTCSYIPEALLSVDGLVPVRLRAPNACATPMADTYLSSVVCLYPRSLLEYALEGGYDFLGGWVFVACCDHLRRLHDNLAYLIRPAFNYVVDVPHKRGAEATAWLVDELGQLAEALSNHFSVDTSADSLASAIAELNGHFRLLGAIGDLRRREHPPISGTDFHKIMVACATAPKKSLTEALQGLHVTLREQKGIESHRARLMVVGSQIDDPAYLQIIESMGGLVVADRFCFGSLPGLEPIDTEGEPLNALAQHSLNRMRCPRMMDDFDLRVGDILRAVEQYRVDGVVVEIMKFCDIWGIESAALVSALRNAKIPVLRLEREYALTGEGQLRTRIQAFLESMGK